MVAGFATSHKFHRHPKGHDFNGSGMRKVVAPMQQLQCNKAALLFACARLEIGVRKLKALFKHGASVAVQADVLRLTTCPFLGTPTHTT